MLPIILAATVLGSVAPAPPEPPRQDPAIRVWLSKRGYVDRMDRVRAYVRTNVDGYVVILHAEPSGRVRVLFPLDPDDDAFVRAGRDYEIRGRGDRDAFTVYDGGGPGVVLAAVSQDPLHFDALTLNRHWDYRVAAFTVSDDPEADLLALVQQMTGGAWFDYDVARYEVATPYSIAGGGDDASTVHLSFYTTPYYGHYWSGGAGFSIGFGWYDPWYDPFYSPGCWDFWYCGYDAWWRYPYDANLYYPYYPVAYYPVGYYAPRYFVPGSSRIRHMFPEGRGGYAFKSYDDRFGLQPRSVEMRRRTTAANGYAATRSVVTPASSGRRTASPASARPAQGTPGSLEARRRSNTAPDGSTKLPSIFGRRPTSQSGAATAPTRAAGAATSGRRTTSPATPTRSTGDVLRRATQSGGAARGTTGNQPRTPSGMRTVTPRTVTPTSPAGTRAPTGTVGSGRTVKPSTGTLERRTPTRGSSVPATRAPTRSTGPATRSAPSRPPSRVSPPRRATPSRPPARVSRPPARVSRPPARTSRPPARSRGRGGH